MINIRLFFFKGLFRSPSKNTKYRVANLIHSLKKKKKNDDTTTLFKTAPIIDSLKQLCNNLLQFVLCSIDILSIDPSSHSSFPNDYVIIIIMLLIYVSNYLSMIDHHIRFLFFFSFFLFVPLICYKKYWRAPARANIKYTLARIVQAVSSSFLSFSLYAVYKFNCLRVCMRVCVRVSLRSESL